MRNALFIFPIVTVLSCCSHSGKGPSSGVLSENKSLGWGIVTLSANYMRSRPSYESSLETQLLMGALVEIVDTSGYWLQLRAYEPPYTAWATGKGVTIMNRQEMEDYRKAEKYICTADISRVYTSPSYDSPGLSELVMGDIIRRWNSSPCTKDWVGVMLPSGLTGYAPSADLEDFGSWTHSRCASPEAVIYTAFRFLGVPYLWGGTSIKGVDCSGLVRLAFFMNGVLLPRNASQMAELGQVVDVTGVPNGDFGDLDKGDLLFFGDRTSGRVNHVALYIGDGRIIHSSHLVRINSLTRGKDEYYEGTDKLLFAKRICGLENTGAGIKTIEGNLYYF